MSKTSGSEPPPDKIWQETARAFFSNSHPQYLSLGMQPLVVTKDGVSVSCLPDESFSAGKNRPHLHSGVLTIILDTVFGMSVFARLQDMRSIATINFEDGIHQTSDREHADQVYSQLLCGSRRYWSCARRNSRCAIKSNSRNGHRSLHDRYARVII